MKQRILLLPVAIMILGLTLGGCIHELGSQRQRLGRLDIVGASGLYIGATSGRSTGSLNRLFKVMPDGTHQVVAEYDEDLRSFQYEKQIAAIYDLNPEWILVGYGWGGLSVEDSYLVSKSTGNVFFLSEIVTFRPDYWNNYWSSTDPFYVYGNTMFMLGNPWDASTDWPTPDWQRKGIYRIDLSNTGTVTGETIVEYRQPMDIQEFIALPNGGLMFGAHSGGQFQTYIRTPSASLLISPTEMYGIFTIGTNSFFRYNWNSITEYRVSSTGYTEHVHPIPIPNVGSLRARNVVTIGSKVVAFGSSGALDITDLGDPIAMAAFTFQELIFAVPFGASEVAIYYREGGQYALDLFDVNTSTTTNVFDNSAFILDSLAAGDGVLYMGGLNAATSRQTVATYDGISVTASDLSSGAAVVIITPIN